jgi:hypothetical protein
MMTTTLDPRKFDFVTRFPVPDDARMHRAGRQGMLDQKEDATLSDAQWVALQHAAWASELIASHLASECIGWALAHGIDPASGQPPRSRERWPSIAERLASEHRHHDQYRGALLADYANYFGEPAALRFAAFIAERARDAGEGCAPAQRELFEG